MLSQVTHQLSQDFSSTHSMCTPNPCDCEYAWCIQSTPPWPPSSSESWPRLSRDCHHLVSVHCLLTVIRSSHSLIISGLLNHKCTQRCIRSTSPWPSSTSKSQSRSSQDHYHPVSVHCLFTIISNCSPIISGLPTSMHTNLSLTRHTPLHVPLVYPSQEKQGEAFITLCTFPHHLIHLMYCPMPFPCSMPATTHFSHHA